MVLEPLSFDEVTALKFLRDFEVGASRVEPLGDFSEETFHMMIKFSQVCSEVKLYDDFELLYWQHLDENLRGENGAVPISRKLHEQIESLRKRGIVSRNPNDQIMLRLRKYSDDDVYYGIFETFRGTIPPHTGFDFLIQQKAVEEPSGKEKLEHIVGVALDVFGISRFIGNLSNDKIEFTKEYHPIFKNPDAVKSEITYLGKKVGDYFKGKYNWMMHGEVCYDGDFWIAKEKRFLPNPRTS